MNRRIIIFTMMVMTIALIGLMGIQIYWITNASAVKEAAFQRTITDVLGKVVSKVEKLEKRTASKANPYQGMENFNRHLPYARFITEQQLDSLILQELNVHGIDTRFEFGIYNPERDIFLVEKDSVMRKALIEKGSAARLFISDIFTSPEYLLLYFPNEKQFLLTELWGMMLISIILIIVIVYSFTYTITDYFHQKKLSEMKNDFINNMTHEFKTPISTISLACEALTDNSIVRSPEFTNNYINIILEENKRLATMAEKITFNPP